MISTGLLGGIFTPMFFISNSNYNSLSTNHQELLNNYQILTGDYDTLFSSYQSLSSQYDSVCSVIKQAILPVQYSFFAEAVRRYYMPIYLGGKTSKTYYKSLTEFYRDIILHDSVQYNSFLTTSGAFSDALKYGSSTMSLASYIMSNTFSPWLPDWNGASLTGNELTDIDTIHQWCIDEIDYEYDVNITVGQESFSWDYSKFPVETVFRTMGDCEDQSILDASYLESCGFEAAISIFHDPNHPTLGDFYHGVCLVHIEDTSTFNSNYPSCSLWRFTSLDPFYPNYTWCFLDPTWGVPFGSEPSWLQDYGSSLSWDFFSVAFCDIGGSVQ